MFLIATICGGLAALGAVSLGLFVLSELTGGSIWSGDPPGYPTLIPVSREGSEAVDMRPGTFWEAMGTFALWTVVLGAIGWWALLRADEGEAEAMAEVTHTAEPDLVFDEDYSGSGFELTDEESEEILAEVRDRLDDPEFRKHRLDAAEDFLANSSLEEKMRMRDEWAQAPHLYDDLIELADRMIREDMGA